MRNFWTKHRDTIAYGFLFVLFYVCVVALLPSKDHPGDMGHWKRWTSFIMAEGLGKIYEYGTIYPASFPCNYPPLLLHFFYWAGDLFGSVEDVFRYYKYFKAIPLIFDIIGALSIFLLIKRNLKTQILPFFLLFNIAYLYNSVCWGQVDSIPTSLTAISIAFALRNKLTWSLIFYVLALNAKLQAITFFPLLGIILLPNLFQSIWRSLRAIGWAVAVQILLISPFIFAGTADKWWGVLTGSVDHYTNISLNAFNFWHLVMKTDPLITRDFNPWWWGVTVKNWGLILFCSFSALVLIPLLIRSFNHWRKKIVIDHAFKEMAFLCAFLLALGFFFFNTQMHERYSHPAMLMAFCYGVLRKNYWIYALTSIGYFLNMEFVLRYFKLSSYGTFVFEKTTIASIFLIALVLGIFHLYRDYVWKKNISLN